MQTDLVVRAEALTKHFGRDVALADVDLEIKRGEVFGYLGPNGAGKTTTLRLLIGMLRPTAGRAEVFGLDAWRDSVAVHRRVGYVPGEPTLYPRLTGHEHVTYFSHLRGTAGPRAGDLADRLDLDLTRSARTLSKGNRQKLSLVLALMSEPELLLLDEPTSGLDPFVQLEFFAMLSEHTASGGSVLLSSHVLGEVQRVADRIGILRSGRLIAVERLEQLRASSLHHVRARVAGPIERADFESVAGLRDLVIDSDSLSCKTPQSALDPLLKRVSQYRVLDFECAEADLEETFMAFYGEGERGAQ